MFSSLETEFLAVNWISGYGLHMVTHLFIHVYILELLSRFFHSFISSGNRKVTVFVRISAPPETRCSE